MEATGAAAPTCRSFWEHVRDTSSPSIARYNRSGSALPVAGVTVGEDGDGCGSWAEESDIDTHDMREGQQFAYDAMADAFVALYVIEGDPQWDFARAAGGLIMHTRPTRGEPPLPRLVLLRGVNQFNNAMQTAHTSTSGREARDGEDDRSSETSSWGGDSKTRFAHSCDIPGIVARPAFHMSTSPAQGAWSVFRTDRISKDEVVGSTDVCTALGILRRRRFRLRKMDVRMCRAALRRRRRVQYQTLSPTWARCSELFRLADAVWSFNKNVSADRSSGGSSNVHYESTSSVGGSSLSPHRSSDSSVISMQSTRRVKKELTFVAPLLEISVVRSVAAVTIQSVWRGYRVRKVADESIAVRIVKQRAATLVQRWWRVQLLRRRCLMLGQMKALLVHTRGEMHLCINEESGRRLATFNKGMPPVRTGVPGNDADGGPAWLGTADAQGTAARHRGVRPSPIPESNTRYCFRSATGTVVAVMSQSDLIYKRRSALPEWTGVSIDLITEAEATGGDYSAIFSRNNVAPLMESFTYGSFDSDDEDDDVMQPASPSKSTFVGGGADSLVTTVRRHAQHTQQDPETASVYSVAQSSYSVLHRSNAPQLIRFSDGGEAKRRSALLFVLTWDAHTMRGVEMTVHPELHAYRKLRARRMSTGISARSTPDRHFLDGDDGGVAGPMKDTSLDMDGSDADPTAMGKAAHTVTFMNSDGRGLEMRGKETAAGGVLGRSGSGINGWRDGWLTAESTSEMAEFEASMSDFIGLNRNISPIRPRTNATTSTSGGGPDSGREMIRERKEQAANLKLTLERLRRARAEFDSQEEQNRKVMINKVLAPSVIVRSTNTSSATFKHYMNDPPMLQMRARQLEKAELVRKKVLVEAMQSRSHSQRLAREQNALQRQVDARNHVYSNRSICADYIAHRRDREHEEKLRRVAYRDWERRQSQEKLMNVTHAKRLSSKLSSLGLSMTRSEAKMRKAQEHISTLSATRVRSDAERRAMEDRRATMRSMCARPVRLRNDIEVTSRRSASAASIRPAFESGDDEGPGMNGDDGRLGSGTGSTLQGSLGSRGDDMSWASATPPPQFDSRGGGRQGRHHQGAHEGGTGSFNISVGNIKNGAAGRPNMVKSSRESTRLATRGRGAPGGRTSRQTVRMVQVMAPEDAARESVVRGHPPDR